MARARNNLGRHFIEWYIEELQEQYERNGMSAIVVSVDPKQPLNSIVVLEPEELRDA